MPKTREQKKQMLSDMKDKIKRSKSVVFARFNALGVKENEQLRNELKKEGSEYLVTKKRLLNLALEDEKIEGLDVNSFEGQVAAIFGYEDEITPVKILDSYRKKLEDKIDFAGAILEGKYLGHEDTAKLATIPSREELYAKLVGSLNAPVSGFVNVLAGNLRGLVTVLKAIEEKKA